MSYSFPNCPFSVRSSLSIYMIDSSILELPLQYAKAFKGQTSPLQTCSKLQIASLSLRMRPLSIKLYLLVAYIFNAFDTSSGSNYASRSKVAKQTLYLTSSESKDPSKRTFDTFLKMDIFISFTRSCFYTLGSNKAPTKNSVFS